VAWCGELQYGHGGSGFIRRPWHEMSGGGYTVT
jgi:hypothetical protein